MKGLPIGMLGAHSDRVDVSGQSMMQNYDTSSGLGSNFHELVHGVDCPFHSSYLDTVAYMDRDAPLQHPHSVCIWEQDTGSPLRRHYNPGGLPKLWPHLMCEGRSEAFLGTEIPANCDSDVLEAFGLRSTERGLQLLKTSGPSERASLHQHVQTSACPPAAVPQLDAHMCNERHCFDCRILVPRVVSSSLEVWWTMRWWCGASRQCTIQTTL